MRGTSEPPKGNPRPFRAGRRSDTRDEREFNRFWDDQDGVRGFVVMEIQIE